MDVIGADVEKVTTPVIEVAPSKFVSPERVVIPETFKLAGVSGLVAVKVTVLIPLVISDTEVIDNPLPTKFRTVFPTLTAPPSVETPISLNANPSLPAGAIVPNFFQLFLFV